MLTTFISSYFLNVQRIQNNVHHVENFNALAVIGNNLVAADNWSEVSLSTNNGISWTDVNNELSITDVISLAVSGTRLYAASWNGDIFYQ